MGKVKQVIKKELKEKDIVDYIIDNWDNYFKDINMFFQTKEWQPKQNYRADLLAYTNINLKEYGYSDKDEIYRASVIIECKFKSMQRDLIYELKKAIHIRDYIAKFNRPVFIGVLSDSFLDEYIYDFILENNIICWKINIKNNDLTTLSISLLDNIQEEEKNNDIC